MAITYHAGRRIQGLERTGSTATFENNFGTTSDWTKVGTTITANEHVSGKCSINDPANSSSDRLHKALGVTLSDTAWVATCEINISAISGSERAFPVQFSSTTGSYRSSHDSIAIRLGGDLSGSSPSIGMSRNDGGTVIHLTDANSIQVSTGTLYYVKIWRNGSDLKLAVYTNSDYATGQVGSTQTHQSLSSPTGLANVVIGTDDGSTGGVNATVDNLKVYNGVTSVVATAGDVKPTNVQAGSRFEETDTRKMYHAQDITGSDVSLTGLKAYYKFNEASGNIINQAESVGSSDSIGTNADMTITGATYDQTGIIGKALSFDGSNDYGTLGSSLSNFNFLHGTGDWSINFWVKYDEFIAEDRFLGNMDSTETRGIDMAVGWNGDPDGSLGMAIKSDNGFMVNQGAFTFPATVSSGAWVMITMTCDYSDTTNTYKVYLNGSAGGTQARGTTGSTGNSEYSLKLAARGTGSSKFFDGSFDELSIWQRELSQSEITSLYNSGSGKIISTDAVWKEEGT